MVSNTVSRAAAPALSPATVSEALRPLAAAFQVTMPADRTRAVHVLWLAAFMFVGALVRFWGLANVGLHGDEETMAMAVRHILVDGQPILPSGMFYPRGMTQLYLMAGSFAMFGESEWALRLPSVLCGTLLIPLSYCAARRYVRPTWSLALASTVAFLPTLILDSQTGRMYIFLVTAVTASLVCLFAWERTQRPGWLVGAVAALIFGLDFHLLAVATVLLFAVPGVLRGNGWMIAQGALAAVVVVAAYILVEWWTGAQYPVPPPEFSAGLGPPPWERGAPVIEFPLSMEIALWAFGVLAAGATWYVARSLPHRGVAIAVASLFMVAILLQLARYYHVAALLYVTAAVIALRATNFSHLAPRLLVMAAFIAVIALAHAVLLSFTPRSVVQIVGAMVGQPSVWPYVRVAELSEVAGLLTAATVLYGLYCFVVRRPIPDFWLLAVLGVVAPMFALGLFAWNVPLRYTEMSLLPMLLVAFALAQLAADRWRERGGPVPQWALAAVTAVLAVGPMQVFAALNSGYEAHPDHKGAAEFMRSQGLTPNDIVLAEDVLQQTYYLGRVDYWLIGRQVARKFVKAAEDGVVDFYTGTPVIATSAMLDELLQKNPHRRIFVIGSGEDQSDGRRTVRGPDLWEAIESQRFTTVFTGRDGLTRVLRAVPTATPALTEVTEAKSAQDADALNKAAAVAGAEHSGAQGVLNPSRED